MKNNTIGYESARHLTDSELARVNGGVAGEDPYAGQTDLSETEMEELRALTGDPEALNNKLAELQAQGRLLSVVETLSGSNANAAPAAEDAPAENTEALAAGSGGLVIHHNAAPLNTLGQLSKNQATPSKSLEKLSSGMKINSAADDPSGYQISERERSQIRLLDQANYNAQNGQSMMKVAEGAVSSTVEILRSLKEKVINAANDTNTEVDRDAIQKEIDASIQQIDDNALLTFNGKFLDNGARTSKGEAAAGVTVTGQTGAEAAEAAAASLRDRNGGESGAAAAETVTFSIVQDGKATTVSVPVGDLSSSGLSLTQADNGGISLSDMTKPVPEGGSVYDAAHAEVQTPDNGTGLRLIGTETGIDGQISAISGGITDANAEQRAAVNSVMDSFTEGIAAGNASGENSVSLQIGANANQRIDLSLDNMRASALGLSGKGATVSVADKTQATAALKVIDNALQRALNQEASIGAVMNRLEYTSNNLTTSSENLQSAESTYRDADMAKEMAEFTKNNILMQAATSMLAQANQQNQNVLSLLQ